MLRVFPAFHLLSIVCPPQIRLQVEGIFDRLQPDPEAPDDHFFNQYEVALA